MNELTKYSWWGGDNEPPAHLKTKNQLSEIGLSPVKAVGIIPTQKYNLFLYDIYDKESVKPKRALTPAQQEAIKKRRKIDSLIKELEYHFCEEETFNNFVTICSKINKNQLFFGAIDRDKKSKFIKKIAIFDEHQILYEAEFTDNYPFGNIDNYLAISKFDFIYFLNEKTIVDCKKEFRNICLQWANLSEYYPLEFPYPYFTSFTHQIAQIRRIIKDFQNIKLIIPNILKKLPKKHSYLALKLSVNHELIAFNEDENNDSIFYELR